MDIFSEASSDSRVLAARHISAEKPIPKMNNAINTTLLCHSYTIQPDFGTYLAGKLSFNILNHISRVLTGSVHFQFSWCYGILLMKRLVTL